MFGDIYNFLFGKGMLKSVSQSRKMSNSRKGIFKFYLSMIKHCNKKKLFINYGLIRKGYGAEDLFPEINN